MPIAATTLAAPQMAAHVFGRATRSSRERRPRVSREESDLSGVRLPAQRQPAPRGASMQRFAAMMVVTMIVTAAVMALVLRRHTRIYVSKIVVVAVMVVATGMTIGKFGENIGLPWLLYYGIPLVLTVFVPPVAFGMKRREVVEYLVLSFVSAPLIHMAFYYLLGWSEFMPFLKLRTG
jgi:hypothetical protein